MIAEPLSPTPVSEMPLPLTEITIREEEFNNSQ